MKVLEFIFTDLVHFAGVTLLLFLLFVAITEMIATWRSKKYSPECQALGMQKVIDRLLHDCSGSLSERELDQLVECCNEQLRRMKSEHLLTVLIDGSSDESSNDQRTWYCILIDAK